MIPRLPIILLAGVLASGCTSGADLALLKGDLEPVNQKTAVLAKETVWVQDRAQAERAAAEVKSLLTRNKTLDADTAVQIALLNNKGLQAAYADLGEAGADVWQSAQLFNPKVAVGLSGIGTPGLQAYRAIEGVLAVNILQLATRDKTVAVARTRFRQAQANAALKTLALAADTRRAWLNAVANRELVAQISQAQVAADAASELAQKLGETGAMTKAAQAREHAFFAELTGQLAKARLAERLAKEDLNRMMGLWGPDIDYRLPSRLPALPKTLVDTRVIEAQALAHRVDLQIARLDLEATAASYGLTQATRFVTDLELVGGFETERERDGKTIETETTFSKELEFVIPIFDSGKARMRKAELAYMRAANRLAEKAVNIRSEARAAHEAYRSTHTIARHYRDSLVPLRTKIEQESLLTYNGMITNTFELLADTRETLAARQLSINAKRDFWIAASNLTTAIHGGGAASMATDIETSQPSKADGDH